MPKTFLFVIYHTNISKIREIFGIVQHTDYNSIHNST